MGRRFDHRQNMRSGFGFCRGSSCYENNAPVMPLRHAVSACLFIIFCLIAVVYVVNVVIVVGLLALLVGLVRLLLLNEYGNPGTSST
jgi:hypothetical protein